MYLHIIVPIVMARRIRRIAAKPRSRKQRGRGVVSTLKSAAGFVKRKKLISRTLAVAGYPTLSKVAGMVGLGRRRRRGVRVAVVGLAPPRRAAFKRRRAPVVRRVNSVPIARGRPGQRGRGIFGKIGGALLSNFLPF